MASLFGYSSTEEPAYTVLEKKAEYEIRQYDKQLRATVTMPGEMNSNMNQEFRALAGYIFGGNTARSDSAPAQKIAMTAPVAINTSEPVKIAMTAPVAMTETKDAAGKQTTMAFILPAKYHSVDELPLPKDSRVKLTEVAARKLAVIRFSWGLNERQKLAHEAKLRAAAERDGVKLSKDPADVQLWGFNPPWTLPWCKRNEVAIPVLE